MSGLRAPVQWEGVANTTTTQNTEQVNLEIESRKERDKLEELLRKEQEQNTKDAKQNELKLGCMHESGCIHNLFAQSMYESSGNKREELEASLRKEQERKTNDCKVKELKKVLELGGIRKIMSDSEYLSILTSDNIREKLLDLIKPVRELESHYLGCSSYYYNQETNTIFEIENVKEELRIVNDKVDTTLRALNKL
jgi:hypothetical protein